MAKTDRKPAETDIDGIRYRLDPGMPPPKVTEAVVSMARELFGPAPEPGTAAVMARRHGLLVQTAWDGAEAVGFKMGYQRNPGGFHSWLGGVREGWRGLGIASRLMAAQHAWCAAHGYRTVRTHSRNKWRTMLGLDLKHGFEIVGTVLEDEGLEIVLEKKLGRAPARAEAVAEAGAPVRLGREAAWVEAAGLGRRAIPCQWSPAAGRSRGVALLLPGARYTCQAPLMHLAARALGQAGYSVLAAETGYGFQPGFARSPEPLRARWVASEARTLLDLALSAGRPREVVLVGKSIGTAGLAALLGRRDPKLAMRAIWLTPLLKETAVRKAALGTPVPSLHVIGTEDPHHDPAVIDRLAARPDVSLVLVQGADHGLEVPGDLGASLDALHDIAESLEAFLEA